MDKVHKAIYDILMLTSAICGGAKIAESEIQDLIDHTRAFVEHVSKPQAPSGMSPEQWKELQKQQRAFHDMTTAPAFQDRLTPDQHKELGQLIKSLPWDAKTQPEKNWSFVDPKGAYYTTIKPKESPQTLKALKLPKGPQTLDPACTVQTIKPLQTGAPSDAIQTLDPTDSKTIKPIESVHALDPTDAPQTLKPKHSPK